MSIGFQYEGQTHNIRQPNTPLRAAGGQFRQHLLPHGPFLPPNPLPLPLPRLPFPYVELELYWRTVTAELKVQDLFPFFNPPNECYNKENTHKHIDKHTHTLYALCSSLCLKNMKNTNNKNILIYVYTQRRTKQAHNSPRKYTITAPLINVISAPVDSILISLIIN